MSDSAEKTEKMSSIAPVDFSKIGFTDDFMFGTVMRNPKLCKQFLEVVLNIKISKIEYPEEQKVIDLARDSKGVRLDVYVEDGEHTLYDIEMQTTLHDSLPKRARYYQGMIDLNTLEKGIHYRHLKKSLVIFVCPFDAYKKDEYIYRFRYQCELSDGTRMDMGDETEKIFVNANGTKGNVTDEFRNLMSFIMTGDAADAFTDELRKEVATVQTNEKWRRDYMTLAMKYLEEREEGRAEGHAEGRAEGLIEGHIESRNELIAYARYTKEHPNATDVEIAAACKCDVERIPAIRNFYETIRNM